MAIYNYNNPYDSIREYYKDPNENRFQKIELSNGDIALQDKNTGYVYRSDGTYHDPFGQGELGYYDKSEMPFTDSDFGLIDLSKFGKVRGYGTTINDIPKIKFENGNELYANGDFYNATNGTKTKLQNFNQNDFFKKYNEGINISNQNINTNKTKQIPPSYKSGNTGLDVGEIQDKLRSIDGITQKYGEANLSDGKFGKNTLSAMIDVFNYLDNYGLSPQDSSNIKNDSSISNKDKIEILQTMLRQYGYVGADGKDLTIDGKFGKNTAKAFSRYLDDKLRMKNEIDSNAIRIQEEQRQLAEQQAREASEREAYRNSPAVRAEQPRRDMFSGVNLRIPDYMQPEDYAQPTQRIVGFDYYGRPIYE